MLLEGAATALQEEAVVGVPGLDRFGQLIRLTGALRVVHDLRELVTASLTVDIDLLRHSAPHFQSLEVAHIVEHLQGRAQQIRIEVAP